MMKRPASKYLKRTLSVILVFVMVLINVFSMPISYAAYVAPTTVTYDFHNLGLTGQGTQEGWSIKDKYDESLALSPQPYGAQIENDASDGWVTFNFDVSIEGWYEIKFLGALAGGGGLTDIIVDGNKIGQYDFYSGDYVPAGELKSLQIVNLTAGTHELKLLATGVANEAWSYRMYPTEMVLTPSAPVPQELVYDFHKLGLTGQETQVGWSIKEKYNESLALSSQPYGTQVENDASDGWATFNFDVSAEGWYEIKFLGALAGGGGLTDILVDSNKVGQYDFYSGDYVPAGELKSLQIVNLTAGTHELKLLATGLENGAWSYRMYPTEMVLTPSAPAPQELVYDFHKLGVLMNDGHTLQETQEGWRLVPEQSNISSENYCGESYGFHVENYDTGNYITFEYDVPKEGVYRVSLSGGLFAGGAVTDVLIDGRPGGTFDFYGTGVPDSGLETLKTLTLTKGKHTLTIKAIGQTSPSWGYCMYPVKLVLNNVDELPILTGLIFRVNSDTLVKGQSTQITLKGELDDGTLNALEDAEIKNYSSDNETVATVDNVTGIIKAGIPGTANITAHVTLRGISIEKTIAVIVLSDVLNSVVLVADQTTLVENTTCGVSIKALLTNGKPALLNDAVIDLTSDNENVIWPTTDTIYAGVPGEANVQLTLILGDVTKTYSIKFTVIKKALSSVEIVTSDSILDIVLGKTKQLSVIGMYNNDTSVDFSKDNAIIAYDSRTPDIASVDATGIVTTLIEGFAVINVDVTIDGITQSNMITLNIFSWENATNKKTRSSLYTPEKIANARNNIIKYDWAKAAQDSAVIAADKYLELGNDFWWNIVTSQNIPRSYSVNQTMNCPICGADIYTEYGNYPWIIDPVNHPWKLICPESGEIFPSNDFEAYYKGGLDENGNFNAAIAANYNDELIANGGNGNLVNELYPDKPTDWGVDDGYGAYADDKSQKLLFIAYYDHWGIWYTGIIQKALDAFRDAYLYTGDIEYAQMGTILLDRIADVYPEMDSSVYKWADGFLNSHGTTGLGKVLGSIWETVLVPSFIRAYDAFYPAMDDLNTINFLKDKAAQYNLDNPKVSVSAIRKNIEDGILRQVLPGVKNCQLEGNTGMEQSCIALAAVVFDSLPETKELIDFNFSVRTLYTNPRKVTGGGLLPILVNNVDRDGQGNECAPGYNYLWLQQLRQVADVMDGYSLDGLDATADLYKNPKFIKMFKAFYPLILSGRYTAAIGDTGGTGTAGITGSLDDCIKGFEKTGDYVLAQLAYYLNHNKADGIHSDIFSSEPDKVASDIKAAIAQYGELKLDSTNLTGFGFAALRDGKNFIKDAGITYNFSDMKLLQQDTDFGYYSSSGTMQFNAMVDGLKAKFSFDVAIADTYEIDLRTFKAASYGIYDIFIDDQKVNTYDFYGTTGAGNFERVGNKQLSEGTHTLSFSGNGRNPANTEAYKMGIIQLSLLNAQAQEIKRISEEIGDTQRDVWMYYGHNGNHGHADTLNLGMHAFGIDVAPELGYPEYTGEDPKRLQWESNTISHNTVVVDKAKQNEQLGGTPLHFDDSVFVKLMDVDASKAYPQTDMYRRTTALIKVDDNNSYTIDLFRIAGGTDHNFSFHSNEGTVTTEGLNLVPQEQGTYAGSDIAYSECYDGENNWWYKGSGFQYLKNVERDTNPTGQFSVDWKIDPERSPLPIEQDVHLKLTMLTQADDVALADGVPPQRPGNPETLKYLIVHRKGANLNSLFASILQPYKDSPFIDSISNVEIKENGVAVTDGSAVAVKVVLKNGRTDYIVNALNGTKTYIVDSKIQFKGFFGVYSEENGQQVYGYVNDGTVIGKVVVNTGSVSGTVADFTKELSGNNEITVQLASANIDLNNLSGRFIYIENDGIRNASYQLKSASKIDDTHIALNIGDTTLIRSYIDDQDFSKGYTYDIGAGSEFMIPLSTEQTTNLNVSIDSISYLIDLYQKSGDLKGPMVTQLVNSLNQAHHQLEKGSKDKAVKHMQDFLKHLNNTAQQNNLSANAKVILTADANILINDWNSN